MYKTLYFCFAGAILLFSVIVVNIAPAINRLVPGEYWSYQSCSYLNDKYKYTKSKKVPGDYDTQEEKDKKLDEYKKKKIDVREKKQWLG